MNKELFVTSTPHETKVGLVEDDQLAEIYLEREGEYTLAGSIYKGRVTRVLPGMQSAFVDIGLERDAFLYVSDFLELEDAGDGDEETVPARPMPADGEVGDGQDFAEAGAEGGATGESRSQRTSSGEPRRDRGYGGRSARGGRRRGGRRDSGSRSGESRSSESQSGEAVTSEPTDAEPIVSETQSTEFEERAPEPRYSEPRYSERPSQSRTSESRSSESRGSDSRRSDSRHSGSRSSGSRDSSSRDRGSRDSGSRDRGSRDSGSRDTGSRDSSSWDSGSRSSGEQDFGPPPGYQPMVLPGESLSKYRNRPALVPPAPKVETSALSSRFPDDEPSFAVPVVEPRVVSSKSVEEHSDTPEQPRSEASVRSSSSAMAAYTQPAALFEVEEEEDEDDPESEEGEQEEVADDLVETEEQQHEDSHHKDSHHKDPHHKDQHEVLAAIPAVPAEPEEARAAVRQQVVTEEIQEEEDETPEKTREQLRAITEDEPSPRAQPEEARTQEPLSFYSGSSAGVMEEEVIDEEEADMAAYTDHVSEHGQYEELEEEVREQGVYAANGSLEEELKEHPMAPEELAEEFQMEQQQDAELEAIQEEAELEADGVVTNGGGAHMEVHAPALAQQRTQRRTGFDRQRGGRRGNNSGGGGRFRRRDAGPVPLISELLKPGQEVLIQIAKEPIAKKGARITSHIALPGRFLVYMPTVNHVGVSRKIDSDEERMRLKRIVVSERENGVGGFIVRTAAGGAAEDELRADIRFLKSLWHEIKGRAETSKAPALIYHDLNVVERVLRDQVTSDFSQIWVDNELEYERVLRFAQRFQPSLMKRIKLYSKDIPLFEQFGLQEEMNKALKSKVWLKSGGYIVINQTEALVAIDVNTGKYVGKTAKLEDTIVKTNVDAIKEIVRQIRLRDLGGIIIIDFIDMDERRNRQKVMQALEEELRGDRAPSKVLAFNDFGLVAITRKRVKQSLERTIGAPCPYCTSTGYVKSATTVCNEIYVEMRKISGKPVDRPDTMLRVNPEVAKVLKSDNGKWLQEMEELLKKTIIVKSDASLHQEQFDLN